MASHEENLGEYEVTFGGKTVKGCVLRLSERNHHTVFVAYKKTEYNIPMDSTDRLNPPNNAFVKTGFWPVNLEKSIVDVHVYIATNVTGIAHTPRQTSCKFIQHSELSVDNVQRIHYTGRPLSVKSAQKN